ncbi:MAG: MBOAT family protein [Pseudomonadota bacterium]
MLFNSYIFIFVFLPVTWLVFAVLTRRAPYTIALGWLVAASLFFYAYWNPPFVLLLILSVVCNYGLGRLLHSMHRPTVQGGAALRGAGLVRPAGVPQTSDPASKWPRRAVLAAGILFNLGLIAYFKYAGLLIDTINAAAALGIPAPSIFLPLGISFFTFQQIAYLVDHYTGDTKETRFVSYALFVTFFPQLIAGPIVHHKEMMPQFDRGADRRIRFDNVVIGLTIFAIGLFKKVVLADQIALYSSPVFEAAAAGQAVTLVDAWIGALGFTLQLYFDFSAYSDMAIGLARLFGIRLPLNFNSPYKATSISDFWRRWHMTLSRFLRDYLYIALGGNRHGQARRYTNLFITMLLGGLWHGAGLAFLFWGALHGVYLAINHAFNSARAALFGWTPDQTTVVSRNLSRAVTFLAVVVGWVFFKAGSLALEQGGNALGGFDTAIVVLAGMAGLNGVVLPHVFAPVAGVLPVTIGDVAFYGGIPMVALFALLFAIIWFSPNVAQIMRTYRPVIETYPGEVEPVALGFLRWKPSMGWSVAVGAMAALAVGNLTQVSEFLYFQF